ncbi:hypothetical protein HI914_03554 [Erysiphe necator]|nr:hypothetical protein HI914_03554 [Erysiphe necator]
MGSLGYLTLNILRIFNILTLILSALTSWTVLIMSFKTGNFYLFDGVSHIVIGVIAVFLIFSESGLFDRYFAKHWPILGPESGLVFLGISMITLGSSILANLKLEFVRDQNEEDEEGRGVSLWHLVLASGILISIFGLFNIIATYIFCDRAQGISGRQIRMYKNVTGARKSDSLKAFSLSKTSTPGSSIESNSYQMSPAKQKKSRFRLPRVIRGKSSHSSIQSKGKLSSNNISLPIERINDVEKGENNDHKNNLLYPELERPPTALHPAYKQYEAPYPASSRYSVVSNMTRF